MVVRGVPATAHSVDSVRDLLLDAPGGRHVRLGDVASVRVQPTPVDVRHDAVSRYVDVRAAVTGAGSARCSATSAGGCATSRCRWSTTRRSSPSRPTRAPAATSRRSSSRACSGSSSCCRPRSPAGGWRRSSSRRCRVAVVGGLLVAVLDGGDLSLGELAGLFAVFAIAVRAVVALVRHLQLVEEQDGPGRDAVLRGARERLVPVVVTAVLTACAVLPLALLGDVAGNEITQPFAVVVLGGLVTSTLLAVLLTPALYLHVRRVAGAGAGCGRAPCARARRRRPSQLGEDAMQHHHRWSAALLLLGALGISACARSEAFDSEAASDEGPSKVEHVKGSDVARIVLTAQAAERLGIRTAAVTDAGPRRTIPYAAVLYDAEGHDLHVHEPVAPDLRPAPDRRRPHQRPGRAAQGGAARRHRGRHGRRRGAARHRVRRRGVRGASGGHRALDRRIEPEVPLPRRGGRRRARLLRGTRARAPGRRRVPRVRADAGGDPDGLPRPVGGGGRGARHRPPRGRDERRARASTSSARSRCRSSRTSRCCSSGARTSSRRASSSRSTCRRWRRRCRRGPRRPSSCSRSRRRAGS